MHINILNIADKKIKEAFYLYSTFPHDISVFNIRLKEQIQIDSEKIIKTYIGLFDSLFYKGILTYEGSKLPKEDKFEVEKKQYIDRNKNSIKVVYFYEFKPSLLRLYIGLEFEYFYDTIHIVQKISISSDLPTHKIRNSFLNELTATLIENDEINIKEFITSAGKNYRNTLSEFKSIYGTTFHKFLIKMKIIDATKDILFTDLSLKEIAYKNNFPNYRAMYMAFHKMHNFPFDRIPRIIKK